MQTFQAELTSLTCTKLESSDSGWIPGINTQEPVLVTSQEDVGTKCRIILTSNGEPWEVPDGALLSVWYAGSSGEGNYTTINGRAAFTVSGNTIEVELITQMLLQAGSGIVWLVMSDNQGKRQTICRLPYLTLPGPNSESEAAQQYYTAFSEYVARTEMAAQRAFTAANTATQTLAGSVQMLGDINSKEALPADHACLFRTIDSNWGGDLPSNYAAYARLRSGRDGNYTMWLGGNATDFFYTVTSDGNMPTAAGWKRVAFANEALKPADMVAALAQKAPAGFGYGETMTYLIESENIETKLDEILATMADQTTKQIQIYDSSFSPVAYICTLWRFTGDYAVLDSVSYGGYKAIKCKWGGTWQPWQWENPPMASWKPGEAAIEYRTTQMWNNGKAVYTTVIDVGTVMGGDEGNISLPAGITEVIRLNATARISEGGNGYLVAPDGFTVRVQNGYINTNVTDGGEIYDLKVQLWYTKD